LSIIFCKTSSAGVCEHTWDHFQLPIRYDMASQDEVIDSTGDVCISNVVLYLSWPSQILLFINIKKYFLSRDLADFLCTLYNIETRIWEPDENL